MTKRYWALVAVFRGFPSRPQPPFLSFPKPQASADFQSPVARFKGDSGSPCKVAVAGIGPKELVTSGTLAKATRALTCAGAEQICEVSGNLVGNGAVGMLAHLRVGAQGPRHLFLRHGCHSCTRFQ